MRRRRDSVVEWLTSLKWDGTSRIADSFVTAFGAEDSEYTRAASANFWKSLAARPTRPGSKADNLVVLEGPQGALKSTALKTIAGPYFGEASEKITSKDFADGLQGLLICEIGEMHEFSRAEVAAIKRTISCEVDRYRPPYGRTTQAFPRRGIFAGTTNRDDWQRDETDGRRFWPIKVGTIDLEYIKANRDQLFAEAVARVNAGETWWEMPLEATRAAQEARMESDVWQETLEPLLDGVKTTTAKTVLEMLNLVKAEQQDKASQMRVAKILRRLGFAKDEGWADGGRRNSWKRSDKKVTP
jgi:predicted P-loop ATPase